MDRNEAAPAPQRLDAWLDVACLFRTRSAAAKACGAGRIEVNGARGKPHKIVRPGDRIEITADFGRRRIVRVLGTAERSIPKAQARLLWEDLTPLPTPEALEARMRERLSRPVHAGRPDARARRSLRKLKGR